MSENEIRTLAESGTFLGRQIGGRLEETHISWVILTKKYAFKVKKPLKLSFLDFSTLAKRKKYCFRELQLNQRFSPIYLAVLPVHQEGAFWNIGKGAGKVVEYAVQMKRMMLTKRMDKLLEKNKVSKRDIQSLASSIASFHSCAEVIKTPFNLANAKRAFNDIRSIMMLSSTHLGKEYALVVKKSMEWSNTFLKTHARRIRERIAMGFYRDIHGDLHSGNIFLYRNPVLFDCIEFNDAYRRIDVINEIGFFCMDLEAFNQARLSQMFQREYHRAFPCFQTKEDERLFVYYKCYRANVRAKVHALAAIQAHDVDSYQHHVNAWQTYLELIANYIK
jgi:aminoglycoside phosphotransferase family enzyme